MAHKIDQLFREKLHQTEVTPSTESWSKVQQQIQPKKKAVWLPASIAAAVVLLLTATMVVLYYEQEAPGAFVAQVDHPERWQAAPAIEVPSRSKQELKALPQAATKTGQIAKQPIAERPSEKESETIQLHELKAIRSVNLSATLAANTSLLGDQQPKAEATTIKITYIAENDTNPKEKLNELWTNLSREVSPSGFLADIRDAKNSLFSRN
ncbi:hypothetical protein [Marinoscillum furvescens]|uniref:Uncharacterized protein n=1 Tax=Marinoscillum furvescens DSM 4134 TaxID=1122208 RepID=A0A3D9LJ16_MARFU|nr:hypothetical protein [Marinoscillum furvescens]REE05803.1 hypothetical protein C7460_101322 [Marinoscillum furvescens DSM 4134]